MAKRFVDTTKWDRAWFRLLSPKMKTAWDYLCCKCDHAGIWHIDMDKMVFDIGEPITLAELTKTFDVTVFDNDKLWLPSFFKFQYGDAKDSFKAKQSALKMLVGFGLMTESGEVVNTRGTVQGQSIDSPSIGIGIGIGKSKEGNASANFEARMSFDFDLILDAFPNHELRSKSKGLLADFVRCQKDFDDVLKAAKNYAASVKLKGTEYKYIQQFPNWFSKSPWRDWIEWSAPKIEPKAAETRGPKPITTRAWADEEKRLKADAERVEREAQAALNMTPEQEAEAKRKLETLIGRKITIKKSDEGAA